jgi:hypothetical protein
MDDGRGNIELSDYDRQCDESEGAYALGRKQNREQFATKKIRVIPGQRRSP